MIKRASFEAVIALEVKDEGLEITEYQFHAVMEKVEAITNGIVQFTPASFTTKPGPAVIRINATRAMECRILKPQCEALKPRDESDIGKGLICCQGEPEHEGKHFWRDGSW